MARGAKSSALTQLVMGGHHPFECLHTLPPPPPLRPVPVPEEKRSARATRSEPQGLMLKFARPIVWLIAGLIGADFVRKIRNVTAEELLHGQQSHSIAAGALMGIIRCTEGASRGAAGSQVRWETGTIALMLLDCAVTLQPASVEDQMALSEFLEMIQDEDMRMWHLQRDEDSEREPMSPS